jgi:predicted  nucleic acid-binding Zn-ribbon protein
MIPPLAALLRLHEHLSNPENPAKAAEIKRLRQSLSPILIRKYELANRRFGGGCVVPMERGICSGCYMMQPASLPEIDEDVHECTHCGRLLYDPDVAYEYSVG